MARRRKGELPRYRLHKQSGQAVVSLPLGGGKYRDFLLGPFDSEDSKREYTRVINEWLAAGMLAPPNAPDGRCPKGYVMVPPCTGSQQYTPPVALRWCPAKPQANWSPGRNPSGRSGV